MYVRMYRHTRSRGREGQKESKRERETKEKALLKGRGNSRPPSQGAARIAHFHCFFRSNVNRKNIGHLYGYINE